MKYTAKGPLGRNICGFFVQDTQGHGVRFRQCQSKAVKPQLKWLQNSTQSFFEDVRRRECGRVLAYHRLELKGPGGVLLPFQFTYAAFFTMAGSW